MCEIACWPLTNFDNILNYCIWKKTCPRDVVKQNPKHWLRTSLCTEWNYWQGEVSYYLNLKKNPKTLYFSQLNSSDLSSVCMTTYIYTGYACHSLL